MLAYTLQSYGVSGVEAAQPQLFECMRAPASYAGLNKLNKSVGGDKPPPQPSSKPAALHAAALCSLWMS